MDPLSDVLRSVRLVGGIFLEAAFTAPWCVTSQMTAEDRERFLAVSAHLIGYHVVIEGNLLLFVDDEPPIAVREGEIVLLPRGEGHMLASAPGLAPIDAHQLMQMSPEDGLAHVRHGGGGETTRIVCGFLGSEEARNPLIAALPRVLTLDVREGMSRDWIEASARFAAGELAGGRLGSSGVMSRLSELLFVEAVRQYSSSLGDDEVGWLKGLKDPHVGRALALIHRDIRADWSAEALAKEVALSRSAFVDRFTALVGLPPIRYQTLWRLETARLQLKETEKPVSQLSYSVGYGSQEAFSRAFKREFGLSPQQWREQNSKNA